MPSNKVAGPRHRAEFCSDQELAMIVKANQKAFKGNVWAGVVGGLISAPIITAAVAIYNEFMRSTRGDMEIILLSSLLLLVSVGPLAFMIVQYKKSESDTVKWTTALGIVLFCLISILVIIMVFRFPDAVFPASSLRVVN